MNSERPSEADTESTEARIPTHNAVDLTEGGICARIVFGAKTYVLHITRAGKLILTK